LANKKKMNLWINNVHNFFFFTQIRFSNLCILPIMSSVTSPAAVLVGLDSRDDSGIIKLVSNDGTNFAVTKTNAFISVVVKTSVESDPSVVDLPVDVKSDVLALIVEYMNHHKGTEPAIVEKPLRSKVMASVVKDVWDAEFINRIGENRQQLYDLTLAANYLDINVLMHLGCAKVASFIKGQPLEKIRGKTYTYRLFHSFIVSISIFCWLYIYIYL